MFRTCDNPEPQYGGDYCNGSKVEVMICNDITCEEGNIFEQTF